jgi:tetratricopeptide (TPR) repeat protein
LSASALLLQREQVFRTLSRRGEQVLLLDLYQRLLASTIWEAAPALAGQLYHELGCIYNALGQKAEACQACQRALSFLRQTDEPALLAATLNELGAVYRSLAHPSLAHACYQEALALCEQAGEPFPQRGITLNNQGRLLYAQAQEQERQRHRGRARALYQQARRLYEQALAAHQRHQLPEEQGWTLLNLADVSAALGQQSLALAFYRQTLSRFRELGERRGEGTALNNLGLHLAYDPLTREQSATCYTQALRIFRAVGDRWQERQALHNLGHWLLLSVPTQEPARTRAYLGSLACFFATRDPLAHPAQTRTDLLPAWFLASLRQELSESAYEECLQEAEAHCWQTIEELLQISHDAM